MSKMKHLITETPQNNIETMHNLVYIKDKEVYLRSITSTGEDMNLYDYVRQKDEFYAQDDNETIAESMCDEIDTPLQLAYWLAVGFAEVRERLKRHEDSGLTPAEVQKLAKIEATRKPTPRALAIAKSLKWVLNNIEDCGPNTFEHAIHVHIGEAIQILEGDGE